MDSSSMMKMTVRDMITSGTIPSIEWLQAILSRHNIIVNTDSYKYSHWPLYLNGTEVVYSYDEARKGAKYNKTVYFGAQYLIKKHLVGKVVTRDKIEEAAELSKAHFGNDKIFNRDMWEYILRKHDGRLPIKIRAVAEGTPVDVGNVMMTVENTDPLCFPLTNHLETLLTHTWSASTTATLSYELLLLIKYYLEETGCDLMGLKFMTHDFGFRGSSSLESASFQGAGHLLNFLGTDTTAAMIMARDYYGATYDSLAFSIPATEHSVMTGGGPDGEKAIFKRALDTYPEGLLAVVIDSYNYRRFIQEYALEFKDQILSRNGKVIFRPDSGDPSSTTIDVMEDLDMVFGSTKNKMGYMVLNPKVGGIWGDGIEYDGTRSILYTLKSNWWAASNIAFGMGGGLHQKMDRDTQRKAFKCSAQLRDGEWYDIFKRPLDSSKASKKGRLKLIRSGEKGDGPFITVKHDEPGEDYLNTVFENGELVKELSFDECRKNTGNW